MKDAKTFSTKIDLPEFRDLFDDIFRKGRDMFILSLISVSSLILIYWKIYF